MKKYLYSLPLLILLFFACRKNEFIHSPVATYNRISLLQSWVKENKLPASIRMTDTIAGALPVGVEKKKLDWSRIDSFVFENKKYFTIPYGSWREADTVQYRLVLREDKSAVYGSALQTIMHNQFI